MRTAGGHQRSEGPQRVQGGWQAEPLGVSSHSVPLPDQVWVWAQGGGAAGKVECLWERMVGFRGGHWGEGWWGQPGRGICRSACAEESWREDGRSERWAGQDVLESPENSVHVRGGGRERDAKRV